MTSHNVPMTMHERWKQRLAITLYEDGNQHRTSVNCSTCQRGK